MLDSPSCDRHLNPVALNRFAPSPTITTTTPRHPNLDNPNPTMSANQDNLSPNGDDLSVGLDRVKLEDGEPRLGPDGEPAPRTDEEYAQAQLTLRAIVSSKEAGVIIGKGGKNVAELRDETGVKAGVSKVVQGVHDRVLTITGGCDAISKAYMVVARALLEGAPSMGMGGVLSGNGTHRTYTHLCPSLCRVCNASG